jgi:hypothetical protein
VAVRGQEEQERIERLKGLSDKRASGLRQEIAALAEEKEALEKGSGASVTA